MKLFAEIGSPLGIFLPIVYSGAWPFTRKNRLIIAFRSRFPLNLTFAIAKWAIASMTVALLVQFGVSLFKSEKIQWNSSKPIVATELDLDKMLTGPLGLYESKRSALSYALEQKLILLMQNVRPDLGQGEKAFRIGIEGSEQQRIVKEEEPIFLNLIEHSTGGVEKIEFSESPSGKQITPYVLDGSSLLLKLGEEEEIILQPASQKSTFSRSGMDIFNVNQAKWWGIDLFFREYGGVDYRTLGQRQKIELHDGEKSYFLFVQAKDFLSYKENRWRVLSSLDEADRQAPLAVVREITNNQLEIEAWDESGLPLFLAKLPKEKGNQIRFSPEELITDPKLRSSSQVSCKIGKKRLVLKPNDWVVKTQTGWRKLVTINEIESYLNNELQDELFVIDTIESNGQMKGRHFDSMRVLMKTFTIQAASSKGKSTKKRTFPIK